MKTAIVRAKVEPELKEEAEKILETLGLSTARAITLLLHQVVLTKGLPLELYIPSKRVEDGIRKSRAGRGAQVYSSADEVLTALKEPQCSQELSSTRLSARRTRDAKKLASV